MAQHSLSPLNSSGMRGKCCSPRVLHRSPAVCPGKKKQLNSWFCCRLFLLTEHTSRATFMESSEWQPVLTQCARHWHFPQGECLVWMATAWTGLSSSAPRQLSPCKVKVSSLFHLPNLFKRHQAYWCGIWQPNKASVLLCCTPKGSMGCTDLEHGQCRCMSVQNIPLT